MAKKMSIILVPQDGEIRKVSVSSNVFIFLIVLLFLALGFIAFLGNRYHYIYSLARRAIILEERVEILEKEKKERLDKITMDLNRVSYENQRLLSLLGIGNIQPTYTKGESNASYIPSIWPTKGWISQGFSSHHKAIDIAAPIGIPIVSTINGAVTAIWTDSLLGSVLEISNKNGYRIIYAHNSSVNVEIGDKVNRGDIVAFVGSSGISSGPHLHYEIYHNDSILNPEEYIPSKLTNP